MLKKVLFIAYQIPPIGGSATQRHLRFLTRLPQFGWNPVVLTVNPDYCEEYYLRDKTLAKLLPSQIQVYRTKSYNPMEVALKVKASFRKNKISAAPTGALSPRNSGNGSSLKGLVQSAKDFVSECFRVPDRQIGWYLFAVLKGIEIIRKEKIKVIYSSGNPSTSHLIGLSLAKLFRLPWMADFRDPWKQNPYKDKRFALIEAIEKKLEEKVVKGASFVICNTKPLQKQFVMSYPLVKPEKFVYISNGYLAPLFHDLGQKEENNTKLIVSHVGSLYSKRSPLPALKAVANLKRDGVLNSSNYLLQFIGSISVPEATGDLLLKLGVEDVVKFVPPLSHEKALKCMADSDVLLIIQPATKLQIPGKIFEYLALGKTIFGVTGDGATADLIKYENLGIVANPENRKEIEKGFSFLLDQYNKGVLNMTRDTSSRHKFESLALTEKLVNLFEHCLN